MRRAWGASSGLRCCGAEALVKSKTPQRCGVRSFPYAGDYLVGAMAGVLESLFAGVTCFFFPFAFAVFLPSSSILPVFVSGVGAMLGVLELWLGSSAFFLAALA